MKIIIYYKEDLKQGTFIGASWGDFNTKEEALEKWLNGAKEKGIKIEEILKVEVVEND